MFGRHILTGCSLIALGWGLGAWGDDTPLDLARRQERQKQVQAETDRMVSRMSTMLRVLDYYRLDKTAQRRLLDQIARGLTGLSKQQMNEVIARLEAALKTLDDQVSQVEREKAYARHREILLRLREMLARYEAIKSLHQAADKLEKASRDELEISLRASLLVHEWLDALDQEDKNQQRRSRSKVLSLINVEGDEQADLSDAVVIILGQLEELRERLPREQQELVQQAQAYARKTRVVDVLTGAAENLLAKKQFFDKMKGAVRMQRLAAADLFELAQILRGQRDPLAALREARDRIERSLQTQETVKKRTEELQARQAPPEEIKLETRALGAKEARVEHEAEVARRILEPHQPDLAAKVEPARKEAQQAEEKLERAQAAPSLPHQAEASKALQDVREELDRRIAALEKERGDPLAALRKVDEKIDQIIKEQKDLRDKTQEATAQKEPQRLPAMSPRQEDLAKQTADVNQEATAAKPETHAALDKAEKAMEEAAKGLKDKKGEEAAAQENKAIQALEEARKGLQDQMAEIEKRPQDIAALENAAKRLDELVKKEGQVAEKAEEQAAKPQPKDTKDLAKQQGEITPQAKEVGKEVEKASPEAAKHIGEGAEHMEKAQGQFEKNEPKPGGEQAKEATKDLQEAQKAIAKALEEKRGQDLAEQAAMQGTPMDAANVADQLGKALEQTKEAAREAGKAAEVMGKPEANQPNLAKLQKQVADKAAEVKAPEAAPPAGEAAQALEKGDLGKALEQQQKALENLEKAAKEQGQDAKGEGKPPAPAEAKNAGELAQAQKALMKATEALAKSQEATQEAQESLHQAQAQAPQGIQGELKEAGQELAKAEQQLHQAMPVPAQQAQEAAAAQLSKALKEMQAAMAAMPHQPSQKPAQETPALANLPQPAQTPGQRTPTNRPQPPKPAPEVNKPGGTGYRQPDGQMRKPEIKLTNVSGEGTFLHLPPRERELIMQALAERLPPPYAGLIQQYYVNIAKGKPATGPDK